MGKLTPELVASIDLTKDNAWYSDGHNLYLRCRGGALSWWHKWVKGGRATTHALGHWPATTIEQARAKRDAMELVRASLNNSPILKLVPVLNPADVGWLPNQLMDLHHVMDRFDLSEAEVMYLLKTKQIGAVPTL